jgi:hypothetical protein
MALAVEPYPGRNDDLDVYFKGEYPPDSIQDDFIANGYIRYDGCRSYQANNETFNPTAPQALFSFYNSSINKKIRVIMTQKEPWEVIRSEYYSLHLMNWYHRGNFVVTSPFGLQERVIELSGDHANIRDLNDMINVLHKNRRRGFRLSMPKSAHMVLHTLLWKSNNSINRKLYNLAIIRRALRIFGIEASNPEIQRVLKNLCSCFKWGNQTVTAVDLSLLGSAITYNKRQASQVNGLLDVFELIDRGAFDRNPAGPVNE